MIGDCAFDLTSEQFGDEVLNYEDNPEQQLSLIHIFQHQTSLFVNISGDNIGKPMNVEAVYSMLKRMAKKTGKMCIRDSTVPL